MILDDLIAKIEALIHERWKGKIPLYDATNLGGIQKNATIPCILYRIADFAPASMPTGQMMITSRLEMRLITGGANKRPLNHRLTLDLVRLLSGNVLLSGTRPIVFLGSDDDNFDYTLSDYESWLSEFEISFIIGQDDWDTWEFYPENMEFEKFLTRGPDVL